MWYPKEVKIRPCKFILLWKGPYILWNVLSNSIILLGSLDEEEFFLINVHKLKPYLVWGKLQGEKLTTHDNHNGGNNQEHSIIHQNGDPTTGKNNLFQFHKDYPS